MTIPRGRTSWFGNGIRTRPGPNDDCGVYEKRDSPTGKMLQEYDGHISSYPEKKGWFHSIVLVNAYSSKAELLS